MGYSERDSPGPFLKALGFQRLGLRQRARKEDGARTAATALAHEEDDVLSTLERALDAAEVIFGVHRLAIDLEDHVAAAQPNVFTEGAGLHVLHDHAFVGRDIQPRSDVGRYVADAD